MEMEWNETVFLQFCTQFAEEVPIQAKEPDGKEKGSAVDFSNEFSFVLLKWSKEEGERY